MRPPTYSLSRRLVAGAAVWIGLSLTVSGIFLSYTFDRAVRAAFEESLTAQLRAVMVALEVSPTGAVFTDDVIEDVRYDQIYSGWYWQIDPPAGDPVRSRSLWDIALNVAASEPRGAVSYVDLEGPRGQRLRAAVTTINRAPAGEINITAAVDTASLESELSRFNQVTFLALGALGLGLAVAVALQVLIGLRPLRRLLAELRAIRDGKRELLGGNHPSEVAPLAAAFNEVRAHDRDTLKRARREVGNLAHALKTPLSRLTVEVNDLGSNIEQRLLPQITEIKNRIDLRLARANTAGASGASGRKVDLQLVAADLVSALSRIYAEKRLNISTDIAGDAVLIGDEDDATEILGNLLDNACKWASRRVVIRATAAARGPTKIEVEDDGNGVPAHLVPHVLDGTRLDSAVEGSGLGLSIVADIVKAYDGTLTLEQSPMGGLRVAVLLPIKAEATTPSV